MKDNHAWRPMMGRAFSKLAFVLVASACIRTSRAPEDDVMTSVRGDNVSVYLRDNRWRGGELLAVDDSSFVVLEGRRVVVAPRSAIGRIDVGLTRIELSAGLSAHDRETLARRSRFPYGMPAAAMNALLRDANQSEPEVLRVDRP